MMTELIENHKHHQKNSGRLCWRSACVYLVVIYGSAHFLIMGMHVLPGFFSPSSLQEDGSSTDYNILEETTLSRHLKSKRSKRRKKKKPSNSTKTGKSGKSRRRRLAIDNAWETTWVDEEGSVTLQMDGEDEDDENPCEKVFTSLADTPDNREMCIDYLSLPYVMPDCDNNDDDPTEKLVPNIYHSVAATSVENYQQRIVSAFNPHFRRNHLGDSEAYTYIYENCGMVASQAYHCLQPPAYRADLFRFCALYTEGGIYLDADILPVVSLEELYSPCSMATIGHDTPQAGLAGKQMKILAGKPKAPIFKCAMDAIIQNVKSRNYTVATSLGISGPQMLHECYEKHSEDVAISYHDTRGARWPYTGFRRGSKLLANEIPSQARLENESSDYDTMFHEEEVYSPSCPLSLKTHTSRAGGVIVPIES